MYTCVNPTAEVQVLRLLVATIATTLFTTALEWLLYPLDCHADDKTMSEWIHGPAPPPLHLSWKH
jgi:hypothetical protein